MAFFFLAGSTGFGSMIDKSWVGNNILRQFLFPDKKSLTPFLALVEGTLVKMTDAMYFYFSEMKDNQESQKEPHHANLRVPPQCHPRDDGG